MKSETPLVSVIVPLYNREKFLPQLWNTLKDQTFQNFELILIDDGSTDSTQQWVDENKSSLNNTVTYKQQLNSGPYVARNYGLQLAKGQYIAFQDSDDEWPDYHLEEFVNILEKNKDIDWILGSLQRIDHKSRKIIEKTNFIRFGEPHPFISQHHEKRADDVNVIIDNRAGELAIKFAVPGSTQCALIRKKIFEEHIFDESYRTAYDRFFAIKLVLLGYKFAYVNKMHQIYHIHDSHISTVAGADGEKLNRSAKTMIKGYKQLKSLCKTKREHRALNKRLAEISAWELAQSFHKLNQHKNATGAMFKAIQYYPYDWRYYRSFCTSFIRTIFNIK